MALAEPAALVLAQVADTAGDRTVALLASLLVAAVLSAVSLLAASLADVRIPVPVLLGSYAFALTSGAGIGLPGLPPGFDNVSSLLGAAAVAGLLPHLSVPGGTRSLPTAALPWLALVGWCLLTTTWSTDPAASVGPSIALVSSAGLFALAALPVVTRRDVAAVGVASASGAVLQSLYALYLAATGNLQQSNGRLERFSTEGGDPNHTAAALLLPLALALWWSLQADTRSSRLLARGAALVMVAAILLTGSRGGLLGMLVVVLSLTVLAPSRARRNVGAVLTVVGLALAVGLATAPTDVTDRLFKSNSTGRTAIWEVGLAACANGCWAGSGFGTFGEVYRQTWLQRLDLVGNGNRPWAAHNVALQTGVETGVVGLVLLVLGGVLLWRAVWRLPRSSGAPVLAALSGTAVASGFVSNLS